MSNETNKPIINHTKSKLILSGSLTDYKGLPVTKLPGTSIKKYTTWNTLK